nr:hypothetical protein BaRGS_014876 [Batillaria attramentaria]
MSMETIWTGSFILTGAETFRYMMDVSHGGKISVFLCAQWEANCNKTTAWSTTDWADGEWQDVRIIIEGQKYEDKGGRDSDIYLDDISYTNVKCEAVQEPGYTSTEAGSAATGSPQDKQDSDTINNSSSGDGDGSVTEYNFLLLSGSYKINVTSLQSPLLCAAPSARFRVRLLFSMLSDYCKLTIGVTTTGGETTRLWYTIYSTWQMEQGWESLSRKFYSPQDSFRPHIT